MNKTNVFLSLLAVFCMATSIIEASVPAPDACAICLEDTPTNPVTTTCKHTFCSECIAGWKQTSNECPTCKSPTLAALAVTATALKNVVPAVTAAQRATTLAAALAKLDAHTEVIEAELWDLNADDLFTVAERAERNNLMETVGAAMRLIAALRQGNAVAPIAARPVAAPRPVAPAYGYAVGVADDDEIPAEILAASRAAVDEDELLRRALENSRRTHEDGERRRAAIAAAAYAPVTPPVAATEQRDWTCPECGKEQGKFAPNCRECMNWRGKRVDRPLALPAPAPRTAGGAVGGYGTPAAHPVVAPTATWKCPVGACGHLNAIDQEKCAKCWEFEIVTERPIIAPRATVPAPIALPAPAPRTAGGAVGGYGAPAAHPVVARGAGSWTCDICTCINDPVMPQCEACGVERS